MTTPDIEDGVMKNPEMHGFRNAVTESLRRIEARMKQPIKKLAGDAAEIGFWAEVKRAADRYGERHQEIALKELKAGIGVIIGLTPFLGQAGAAAGELAEAAVLEGATVSQAKTIAEGGSIGANGVVRESLTRIFGKEAMKGATKWASVLDTAPDMPDLLKTAGAGLELCGVQGASAIAPAAQMVKDRWDMLINAGVLAKDIVSAAGHELSVRFPPKAVAMPTGAA